MLLAVRLWDMKNVTVALDDDTYRKARIRAAELETSVSAAVRKYLTEFAAGESDFQRLQREEEALRAQIEHFSAADRLSRDAIHGRKP
jgi:plasmid stability protein